MIAVFTNRDQASQGLLSYDLRSERRFVETEAERQVHRAPSCPPLPHAAQGQDNDNTDPSRLPRKAGVSSKG